MAIAKHIIPGEKFGRLTVLHESEKRPNDPHRRVMAQCECGTVRDYAMSSLRIGHATSCGCIHGHARIASPTYQTWSAMKNRCSPKNGKPGYAGKGISVCQEWSENFETFLMDMGERPKGMTLDRFPDKNGNYEPRNCRWATSSQQANNRGNCHQVTAQGKTLTVMEWADMTGINFHTIRDRLKRGWSNERAVSEPPMVSKKSS